MLLVAVASKDELVALIEELTPFTVALDHRRAVTLGRPHTIELVPNRGLRVGGNAWITWDLAGVEIPVTVQQWQLLLVPKVKSVGRVHLVALEPVVEQLDLRLVPDFLEDRIANAIREGLAKKRDK